MAKNSSAIIMIVLLALCCANAAYSGRVDTFSDSRFVFDSDSSRLIGRFPALWVSDLDENGLQCSKVLKLKEASQLSDLQWGSYYPVRCCESPEVSIIKAQSGLSESVKTKEFSSEPESDSLIEISELRPGPFFITEAINMGAKRIPDSSTMLLLGVVLVGLAGYGGRKKFKR
jgi:LPXTG-motif cell wall-anchored protein